mgnify:CR=1 FL=1
MTDTHINAYFVDVDEAQQRANQANAELGVAKDRLEAKKKEAGFVEVSTPKADDSKHHEVKPLPHMDSPFTPKKK